ncbi:MAG TPA: RNA methyltransferase [Abditibacterium sp.]|jgi:TrmH family RNA methyltransferase
MKSSFPKEVRSRSPRNTQIPDFSVDLVASLLPLTLRHEREARGLFLLEGLRCVHLALETDCLETLLFAVDAPFPTQQLVRTARENGVHCVAVEDACLLQLACGEDPQGVIGVGARRPLSLSEAFADEGVWIALESVQKPGNLGSIIRTAEAAGARGVIAVGSQIDFFAPSVIRSSMGAFFAQKLVRASWNEVLDFKIQREVAWLGTCLDDAVSYDSAPYPRDFWLWMGDEQSGLSERTLNQCDARLSIPMQGRVDSLNLGVATGIVLFGARRKK